MSAECASNRNKIFVVLLTLAALALLAGNACARNPDLSNWTINLSGDEPAEEVPGIDSTQEIEVVGATVHVTYWAYLSTPYIHRLYYRRSTDGGRTWHPKIPLGDTPAQSTIKDGKYLAVDGTSVHVAYVAGNFNCKLMYRRSTDNGASFEAARG